MNFMSKCPYCDYTDILYGAYLPSGSRKKELGEYGKFFEPPGNSMQLMRKDKSRCVDIASIVGCPKCKKMFIETD